MRDLCVGAAQFEHHDNDKAYNLGRIRDLTRTAIERGAEIVSFHECAVSGYSFIQPLCHAQLLQIAEPVPGGPSTDALVSIAREYGAVVMAGLLEALEKELLHVLMACIKFAFDLFELILHFRVSKRLIG